MSTADPAPDDGLRVVDCAEEPIRVPGTVQPHDVLLAARRLDLVVVVASRSSAAHLGRRPEDLLGRPLTDVVPAALLQQADDEDAGDPQAVDVVVDGTVRPFEALVHTTSREEGDLVVLELEPRGEVSGDAALRRTRPALRALQRAASQEELCDVLAVQVRRVTGFDRVMVYRFDEEWNGVVVAEQREPDLEPFLGLHYPASDIPAQARALYTSQWLRSIPDAGYEPSPLVPPSLPSTGRPLDLGGAALRSVSPVHLQYLANMGVRASMSVSLIVHGRLWGLVACHHYAGPHHPSPSQRGAAEFLGRTGSLLMQGKEDEARNVESMSVAATAAELTRALTRSPREAAEALAAADAVLDLVEGSTGCVVRLDGRTILLGDTPSVADVDLLVDRFWPRGGTATVVTNRLGHELGDDVDDLAERLRPVASGLLAVRPSSGGPRDVIAWCRPEVLKEVHWAGDPHTKGFELTPEGVRLTPRSSFATWVEQVRGTSERWRAENLAAAEQLVAVVDEVLTRRRTEDERLTAALQRIVLTESPVLPAGYELGHRYRPSGSDVLGGDWYDVTPMADGRTALVVGDVAGHGLSVAAVTAQVRHALRAYLLESGSAADALSRLDAVVADLVPGELATLVACELDPATGDVTVTRAGHLPPVVVRAGGAELVTEASGAALGVGARLGYTQTVVHLEPGEALLLYTDGLVEERRTPISDSLDRLRDLASERLPVVDGVDDLAADLLASAPDNDDDVTVLVVRRA